MSRDQYDRINAVNFSTLKEMLRSPAHYRAAVDEPEKDDPTRYAVGTLCHAMVLEKKNLLDLYAVKPEGMRFSTKEGKAWKAEQTLPIITQEQAEGVPRMAAQVCRDTEARKLIAGCRHREHIIEWEYEGVSLKCLLDMWGETMSGAAVGDYKTTQDCRELPFAKKADLLDYDMQIVMYSLALQSKGYEQIYGFWIAQETSRPFVSQVWHPCADMLVRGRRKFDYCIALLKQCQASNFWPGYGEGIKLLKSPKWQKEIAWGTPTEEAA